MKNIEIEYIRPYLYPKQEAIFFCPERYSFCESSTKAGKCQPLGALISTPHGWKRMGDMQIGDIVHGLNGNTKVLGVYPQGKKLVYEVLFSDGSKTEACADHIWTICNSLGQLRNLSTKELISRPNWDLKRSYVPQHSAVEYIAAPPKIDPWLLGYLIGDGGFTQESLIISIGHAEEEQFYKLKEAVGWYGCDLVYKGKCDYVVRKPAGIYKNPLIQILKAYKLWGCGSFEKFVPDEIKFGSIQTRKSFIQGILDSDGWVNKHGQPVLEQCSAELSKDFIHIIRSLGGVVRSSQKTSMSGETVYVDVVSYVEPASLFRMSRKIAKCKPPKKPIKKTFKSITLLGEKMVQCIKVSAPDSLYLTDDFIATHNTTGCIVWLLEMAILGGQPGYNYWWVAPVRSQAKIAYNRIKLAIPPVYFKSNESELYIELINGAKIWFKSGDNPDSLYGEDVYAAVMDEASRARHDSYIALRTTLTATRGPLRMIANVIGKNNWFYIMCRAVQRGRENARYAKITAMDAVDAGVLAVEEIEDAKKSLPEREFKQLYYAEAYDDDQAFIPSDIVEQAMQRTDIELRGARVLGADPSQGKRDSAAFALRQGQVIEHVEEHRGMDEIGFKGHLIRLIQSWRPNFVFVDGTGFGTTIVKDMWENNSAYKGLIKPINFQARTLYPDEYKNKRAEMWGEMRKWLMNDNDPVQLPDNEALAVELTCINKVANSSGLLQLESKEDLEARGYESPNLADALALTFAEPISLFETQRIVYPQARRNRMST